MNGKVFICSSLKYCFVNIDGSLREEYEEFCQPEFIDFIHVVLNECEGPHCRSHQNFLITCLKRFFAFAQNDEKAVIASDSKVIYSYKRLLHFVRNDKKSIYPFRFLPV